MLAKLFCAQLNLWNQGWLEPLSALYADGTHSAKVSWCLHLFSIVLHNWWHISSNYSSGSAILSQNIREYSELEGPQQLSCCSKSKVTALHGWMEILMCLHVRFLSPSLWIAIVLYFIFEAAKGRLCIGCITLFLITATCSFVQALSQTPSLKFC